MRTLVCHPGGPGMSGRYFGDLAGLDGAGVRVVAIDPPAGGPYGLEDYADRVDAVRRDLGLERIDLLGHSHGGFVALVYALRHPEHLDHLVLLCTAARFSTELRSEVAAALRRCDPAAVAALRRRAARDYETPEQLRELIIQAAPTWFADPAKAAPLLEGLEHEAVDMDALHHFNDHIASRYDMRASLGRIRAPTLILNGERDTFAPRVTARELSAIPGSRAVLLPGVGHFPFIEDPEAFRRELGGFLGL